MANAAASQLQSPYWPSSGARDGKDRSGVIIVVTLRWKCVDLGLSFSVVKIVIWLLGFACGVMADGFWTFPLRCGNARCGEFNLVETNKTLY